MTPDRPLSAANIVSIRQSKVESDLALASDLKVRKKPVQFKTTPDGEVFKDADSYFREKSEEDDDKHDFVRGVNTGCYSASARC